MTLHYLFFLNKIFDKNRVHIEILHRDIFSKNGINPTNVIKKITEILKEYAVNNHLKKQHFERIIHITDTDGVFIPDGNVVEDNSIKKIEYSLAHISCKSKEDIIDRNKVKRQNLLKMASCDSIWSGVPYGLYYMSCNLDHVLYNALNSTDDEKEANAKAFLQEYKTDVTGFVNFMRNSDFSIVSSYKESWDFIQQGLNSLNRYSNFVLCFENEEDSICEINE